MIMHYDYIMSYPPPLSLVLMNVLAYTLESDPKKVIFTSYQVSLSSYSV